MAEERSMKEIEQFSLKNLGGYVVKAIKTMNVLYFLVKWARKVWR